MELKQQQAHPAKFRQSLLIDADGQTIPFRNCVDPWQQTDFEALDTAWQRVVGQDVRTTYQRAWLERPRGHSKTSDIALMVCWALFSSRRKLAGVVAAADTDQAAILRDCIERLLIVNPWLQQILDVQRLRVHNIHTKSEVQIVSSDVASSWGTLADFIVCDEVSVWQKPGLWESLFSAAAKRANCLLLCIGNAGFGESWQWELREKVRTDPRWYFSRLDGPKASWITEDRLAEQKRLLPSIAYRRLWLNQWTTGSGDALADTDINRAVSLNGPLSKAEPGWIYVAGLDLGLSRDKAALAVVGRHVGYFDEKQKPRQFTSTQQTMIDAGLWEEPEPEFESTHVEGTGRLKLARLHVWSPADSSTGKVDIEQIEETIAELDTRFQLAVGADPWQAAYLIERLQKRGVPIEPVDFTSNNLKSMCSATLEAFSESQIELYADPQLMVDLKALRVVEKSYGVRLDSPRGVNGHGDCATALAIALHVAKSKISIARFSESRKLIAYP